jgi:hypothetical protein
MILKTDFYKNRRINKGKRDWNTTITCNSTDEIKKIKDLFDSFMAENTVIRITSRRSRLSLILMSSMISLAMRTKI